MYAANIFILFFFHLIVYFLQRTHHHPGSQKAAAMKKWKVFCYPCSSCTNLQLLLVLLCRLKPVCSVWLNGPVQACLGYIPDHFKLRGLNATIPRTFNTLFTSLGPIQWVIRVYERNCISLALRCWTAIPCLDRPATWTRGQRHATSYNLSN